MLVYTIPPAMRNHASVVIETQLRTCIGVPSSVDEAYNNDDPNKVIFTYVMNVFRIALDAVMTERLLGIATHEYTYIQDRPMRYSIRANWDTYKDFFKSMECSPELPIQMAMQNAYDASYDSLIDADTWLDELDKVVYKEASETLDEMEDLMAMVDNALPDLIPYADQHQILYASFKHGLIIFS